MSNPERHHYFPKALLRGFCFEGESTYYMIRGGNKGPERRNINSILCKRHLNTYEHLNGERDVSLETFFAENFDDRIGGIVSRISKPKGLFDLQDVLSENRRFLVQFIYNHQRRTPEFLDQFEVEGMLDGTIRRVLKATGVPNPSENDVRSTLNEKQRASAIKRAKVHGMARQSKSVLDLMNAMNLVLAMPEGNKQSFIAASNPVIRATNDGDTNLKTGDVEIWAVIAPKILVGLIRPHIPGGAIILPTRVVRKVNETLFKQSRAAASGSKELLLSLNKPR